ncbi:Hachiman antiphage defense system protein HamA [Paenibacillus sp. S02]|uniref:Hachiman antiphage defense system protein HamA n=1 Tax=Paenibacillus sp. S02 TaxID=2823904 RepID=UPI003211C34D
MDTIKYLYKTTAKINCRNQGTAFLIDEKRAITARHCIKEHIDNNEPIELEFYPGSTKSFKRYANLIADSIEDDMALLEITDKVTHIEEWLAIDVNSYDSREIEWESMGYPKDWNTDAEGDAYCYLRGQLYFDSSFDDSKEYDKQLTSNYIKEDWPYGLSGLSGAPLLVDKKIVGILIKEEYSLLKNQLKSVSFFKCANFLLQNGILINSSLANSNNLLKQRLDIQKRVCNDIFNKINHSMINQELNMDVDFYYVKYHESGNKRISELAEHLTLVLQQYANSLTIISSSSNDLRKQLEIFKNNNKIVSEISKSGKLGSMLLWMLIEGILEMPKMYTRIRSDIPSTELNYISDDVHAGLKNGQLALFIGGGILHDNFEVAITTILKELEEIVNMENDILFYDDYSYETLNHGPLKTLIDKFFDSRDWSKVNVEMTVFTGYNSELLNMFEKDGINGPTLEKHLNQYFISELKKNYESICHQLLKTSSIKNVKINWFILPFNKIIDFENQFMHKIGMEV